MKYQTNLIKNVNGNPIFIKINLDLDAVNATIDHFWKNQIGGTRLPSTNFFSPQTMRDILYWLAQDKSINQIAKIIHFSPKAIRNNLKLSIYYEDCLVDQNGKIIRNLKKYKGPKYRLASYSFKKWMAHFRKYCHVKKKIGLEQSQKQFALFFKWFNNNIDHLIKTIKVSANVIIYHFIKYLKKYNLQAKIPTEQTIYNWVAKKDHSFTKQWFIKLSKGLFGRNNRKKKHLKRLKIYHEKYLSINELPEAAKLRTANHYWELDTVEGKKSDQHVLMVMINRKTRRVIIEKVQRGAQAMLKKLIDVYHKYQLKIDGLIIDNGSENAYLHCFDQLSKIYRCNPNCPTDKPSVENVNRLIRYWVAKATSIEEFSQAEIKAIEDKINHYPRKVLMKNQLMSAYEYEEILK